MFAEVKVGIRGREITGFHSEMKVLEVVASRPRIALVRWANDDVFLDLPAWGPREVPAGHVLPVEERNPDRFPFRTHAGRLQVEFHFATGVLDVDVPIEVVGIAP